MVKRNVEMRTYKYYYKIVVIARCTGAQRVHKYHHRHAIQFEDVSFGGIRIDQWENATIREKRKTKTQNLFMRNKCSYFDRKYAKTRYLSPAKKK